MRGAGWSVTAFVLVVLALQLVLPGGVPLGIIGLGLTIGSLNALLAVGLVLVYRSDRIVNFAHAELGAVTATLTYKLVTGPGLNYFAALLISLVAALVLGALVEVLVIRRFAQAPRLVLTVATIGLAQVLAYGEFLISKAITSTSSADQYTTPVSNLAINLPPVRLTGDFLLAVLLLPVVVGALALFLNRTSYGAAVRASSEGRERAAQLGIPVKAISTQVWMIAAVLAMLAASLRAPVVGITVGTALGPGLLLQALAPAVVGRMQNLPVTVIASLLLGIVAQAVYFATGSAAIIDVVALAVIAGVLLVRRGTTSRAEQAVTSSWRLAEEMRPVPAQLRHLREIPVARSLALVTAVGAVTWAATSTSDATANLLTLVPIYALIGLSFVVLTGWAGQISLGQFALVGVGAAVAGKLNADYGGDFLASLIVGSLAAAAVALVIGLVSLRVQGFFLAVTTLAFAVAAGSWFLDVRRSSWLVPVGDVARPVLLQRVDLENERAFLVFCTLVLTLAAIAVRSLRTSRTGRVIVAMRDNERAVQAYGVSLLQTRLVAFAVSGLLAGLAGGLFVHHQHGISLTSYTPTASLSVFSMAVIGGLGSVSGALLGAGFLIGVQYFTEGPVRLLAIGFGQLFLLLFLPGGLGALLSRARDAALRLLARRHGIRVPSLLRDDRQDTQA